MLINGATFAYRGYRLQALYSLNRILGSISDEPIIFLPENGGEDLGIEEKGVVIEIAQVKSYENLSLSDLKPREANSFFHRAIEYLKQEDPPVVKLINFGKIGPELTHAWEGEQKNRQSVVQKLITYEYKEYDIELLLDNLQIFEIYEEKIEDELYSKLQAMLTGIDPVSAFDLLNYWIYLASENKERISKADAVNKVNSVGKFINGRAQFYQEWFTSINPIEDFEVTEGQLAGLAEEYFRGVSARYEHILANLDFRREDKLEEVRDAFKKNNVVIIHAASGQGKTTLAFRYIHDYFPEQWRFSILAIENRQHMTKIATALSSHADALQAPMLVFIDVSPRDLVWAELVKQLSHHSNFQVLVAIREEDFRRSNIPGDLEYSSIDLSFNEDEANQIYNTAIDKGIRTVYLTFDDAWEAFGEKGPLLEFVYLLTQTKSLRQRLEEQIDRLQKETREKKLSPDELLLLRLVAIVTALEGRLRISTLIPSLNLPEPNLTLKYYEKEYLLRISGDETYIEALHPIRSRILVDLLVDPATFPWIDLAARAIPNVPESDWEIFFLHIFIDFPQFTDKITDLVNRLIPHTWTGLAGGLRCLLWISIKKYIETNRDVIESSRHVFGPAWFFIPDLNFGGTDAPNLDGWWNDLGDLIPDETKQEIEKIRGAQSPKSEVFETARLWLDRHEERPNEPIESIHWDAAAEVLYWAYRFELAEKVEGWLSDEALSYATRILTLEELSEVSLALFLCNPSRQEKWFDSLKSELSTRLVNDYQIIAFEDTESVRTIHFLSYPEFHDEQAISSEDEHQSIHEKTMEKVQLIRQLFPRFEKYGSQGYGHQIPDMEVLPDDSTKKGISIEFLVPKWPLRVNGIASGLVRFRTRSDTWDEYIESVLGNRECVIRISKVLLRGIGRFFERSEPYNFLKGELFQIDDWNKCQAAIQDMPLLPKTAVDPWGIGQPEGTRTEILQLQSSLPKSILQKKYKPYQEAERGYLGTVSAFMDQAIHVSVTNIRTGKLPENSTEKQEILNELQEAGIDVNSGERSVMNFWEIYSRLPEYQKQFRSLFIALADMNRLKRIEQEETEVNKNLWRYWVNFVGNPGLWLRQTKVQLHQRDASAYETMLNRIHKVISKSDDLTIRVMNADAQWDGDPTLWINIDIHEVIEFYSLIEKAIYTLRDAIGQIEYGESAYYLLEENCKFVVIVPTFQGKMIEPIVWPLRTTLTLTQEHSVEEKMFLYFPQEIPYELLEHIDIKIWRINELDTINEFEAAFSGLNLKMSLLERAGEIPDFNDEIIPIVQEYFDEKSKDLSENLQRFIDGCEKFASRFNSYDEEEQLTRTNMRDAIQALDEILTDVLSEDGTVRIQLNEANKFSKKLREFQPFVSAIKLIWLEDVFRNNEAE